MKFRSLRRAALTTLAVLQFASCGMAAPAYDKEINLFLGMDVIATGERVRFESSNKYLAEVFQENGEFKVRLKRPGDVYITKINLLPPYDRETCLVHIANHAFWGSPPPVEDEPVNPATVAHEILTLVNQERAKVGLRPLRMASDLMDAAKIRAEEIKYRYAHVRPDGRGFQTAIRGHQWYSILGENADASAVSAEDVMSQWMASQGHRNNILHPSFTEIGIGYHFDPNSDYKHYWVQIFRGR